ncbi:MAG TPA: MFS transporter [Dehalococcoidia bacterium]|nr:MFS transporter [Dehalococcoidia bacterium]
MDHTYFFARKGINGVIADVENWRSANKGMNLISAFTPRASMSERETARGMRVGIWQVAAAGGLEGITTGGFLAAFALVLGATNLQIGILTALPFFMQPIQIPAMLLVERLRLRKAVAVPAYFFAQSSWIPIALIPIFIGIPSSTAVSILLVLIGIRGIANAFFNNTWISWLRDLVPQEVLGSFFSSRQAAATLATAVVGLGAAFYIDLWRNQVPEENLVFGYAIAYLMGTVILGWTAVTLMALIPEPQMQAMEGQQPSFRQSMSAPFRDRNFRRLINFLFIWNVAANMAIPFFAVYMLTELGVPLSAVIGLGVLSQVSRILFVRVWGPIADKFGSKVVLSLSASLFLLVFLGWTFTAAPDPHFLTWPLLAILHIFAGVATAGINLTDMTLRMKLAPRDQGTTYLTGASLAINLGSGISPLIGGFLADFFSVRQLTFTLGWIDPSRTITFAPINLSGFDFLFAAAFALGVLSLNLLAAIREEGEVDRQVVLDVLLGEARESFRSMSSVPALGFISVPYSYLRRVPGMDVAVSVTAYQIAASTKSAVSAISRGRSAVGDIADQVAKVVAYTASQVGELGGLGERQLVEIARHAARGAIHALDDVSEDVEKVAKGAVLGTVRALNKHALNPYHVMREIGFGTVQGAGEVGADVTLTSTEVIAGAREAAQELGISESEAVAHASEGIRAAAESIGPEAAAAVRIALSEQVRARGMIEQIDW